MGKITNSMGLANYIITLVNLSNIFLPVIRRV